MTELMLSGNEAQGSSESEWYPHHTCTYPSGYPRKDAHWAKPLNTASTGSACLMYIAHVQAMGVHTASATAPPPAYRYQYAKCACRCLQSVPLSGPMSIFTFVSWSSTLLPHKT